MRLRCCAVIAAIAAGLPALAGDMTDPVRLDEASAIQLTHPPSPSPIGALPDSTRIDVEPNHEPEPPHLKITSLPAAMIVSTLIMAGVGAGRLIRKRRSSL